MGRRFVDGIWIQHRMRLTDARIEQQLRVRVPQLLRPEVVPFVEVEIVRVPKHGPLTPIVEIALVPKSSGGER